MTNKFADAVVERQEKVRDEARESCTRTYGAGALVPRMQPVYNESAKSYMCPAYWDEIVCWPDTPAGTVATVSCPEYIAGFLPTENATKRCLDNGIWYMSGNKPWTNYTTCAEDKLVKIYVEFNNTKNISDISQQSAPLVAIISESGYIVSCVTLIIAFAIMLFIKKLHCARNILHMHLFASFIFRALIAIAHKHTFVEGIGFPSDLNDQNGSLYFDINVETNNWSCKLMFSFWQYFITANYSWILMEGLYLHNLIFRALFADSSNSIKGYVIMGWGLPLIVIGCWSTARVFLEDTFCWTTMENPMVFLIILIPTAASNLLNLCLFVRISVVLYIKLRSPINEESRRYQKWMKSTLVLVPLFGIHYALFLSLLYFRTISDVVYMVYLFCDLLFGSFQGFFVALLFCFLNNEVKSEIQPHLYYFLTFLATNKYSKCLFPFRKKFLRSVVGRTSVCTTMSCSSLYTNGILHRNSKCRLDSISKIRTGDKFNSHNTSRRNSRSQRHSQPFNFMGTAPTTETTLCIEHKQSEAEINDETLKMVVQSDF